MNIIYEGTDITDDVNVTNVWHDMHLWGSMDSVHIQFGDGKALWDRWSPQAGDTIDVEDGPSRTGKMWVRVIKPIQGVFELIAYPVPPSMRELQSRSWDNVRLTQLIEQIAGVHGLGYELYGVTDQLYSHIEQRNVSDMKFLNQRLTLEGLNLVFYNGKIIVSDGLWVENQTPKGELTLLRDVYSEEIDNQAGDWGSCTVTDGSTRATFTAYPGKTLMKVLDTQISNQEEAARFAKGLLREANRDRKMLVTDSMTIITEYAPGSVVNLDARFTPSWSGKLLVARQRNYYSQNHSKLWFVKPLEY